MMTTIRSFIAIELTADAAASLTTLQRRLKTIVPPNTVRWTAVENIHLTLHFLGDTATANIEQIKQAMQSAATACPPLSLALAGLGCFPNTRRPNIVWVGVQGDLPPLVNLQRNLGEQLQRAIGFKPESRPYSPHLTIGRVKKDLPARLLGQLGQELERERGEIGQLVTFDVSQISLIKSDLKPAGPVYTPLAHAQLMTRI